MRAMVAQVGSNTRSAFMRTVVRLNPHLRGRA